MYKDYRIFIGIFPEGNDADDLAARIQATREQVDIKTAVITPPHVTLAGTYWRGGPPVMENELGAIASARAAASLLAPFPLTIGGIDHFPPETSPVIFMQVEVTPALLEARSLLLDALGKDEHPDFHPHLTLAMRLQGQKARRTLSDLEASEWAKTRHTFTVSRLQFMQRGPADHAWRCIAVLELEGGKL